MMPFSDTPERSLFNPYYNARQLDWRDGTYFTKFFVDKMNTDNDPRRVPWFTTVLAGGVNVYQGIESGYLHQQNISLVKIQVTVMD